MQGWPAASVITSFVHEELPSRHFASYWPARRIQNVDAPNLSIELAPFGITINNIAPGCDRNTPQHKNFLNDP